MRTIIKATVTNPEGEVCTFVIQEDTRCGRASTDPTYRIFVDGGLLEFGDEYKDHDTLEDALKALSAYTADVVNGV
jgi:hypothetical protein